ncbi:MAG: GNAT family N-acetyltransferase [Chloroflexota bacterium]
MTSEQHQDDIENLPDKNFFMMCEQVNPAAFRPIPTGFHVRNCRQDELDIWKRFPFDNPADADAYMGYMSEFFNRVYAPKGELFFETCKYVCDGDDTPIGTAFIWKVHERINTVHWVKVLKGYEDKGIGRALMTHIMQELTADDFPIFLHTQPGSFRAIKLYSDFGFNVLTDPVIGVQSNDWEECMPILKRVMPEKDYANLELATAPSWFIQTLESVSHNNF